MVVLLLNNRLILTRREREEEYSGCDKSEMTDTTATGSGPFPLRVIAPEANTKYRTEDHHQWENRQSGGVTGASPF